VANKRTLFRHMVEVLTGSKPGAWVTLNIASRVDPFLLRMTQGRFSSSNLFGFSALMLTTTGAKTGLPRRVALIYFRDGERLVIVASRGGMDKHAGWYHNLTVHSEVDVLLNGSHNRYTTYEATGEERERLWAKACEYYAGFSTYQARAKERLIPIIVLVPHTEHH
jgi:deazaflavin-dependent oxidoreductase (nitroreductase family)